MNMVYIGVALVAFGLSLGGTALVHVGLLKAMFGKAADVKWLWAATAVGACCFIPGYLILT